MQSTPQLTSTTAPGKVFASRAELAEHYKSDWHKYNLKRREAGLPLLLEADFQARLEAAKALRQEKQAGKQHLKVGKKQRKKKPKEQEQQQQQQQQEQQKQTILENENNESATTPITDASAAETDGVSAQQLAEEAAIEIEPRQCLFDSHYSKTVQANVDRMQRKYGFFLPDVEYLTDAEGLIGYCHEKIKLGHICLYCQRVFSTWQGAQKHMISKRHTKLRYEANVDLDEFSVFYDFSEANAEFLGQVYKKKGETRQQDDEEVENVEEAGDNQDDDEDDWEDVSEDEEELAETKNEDEEDLFDDFDEQVTKMGFDVTALGELILPDGRIVGHRSLRRYYKQRAPRTNDSAAVLAARRAAQERLYRGRVYTLGGSGGSTTNNSGNDSTALTLTQAGVHPCIAAGRAGKGLLVPSSGGGSFSAMSIYRYRAAVRKQRRGEFKGQRIYNKTNQNINRMDKKHNRLMNGVSVAHAAR